MFDECIHLVLSLKEQASLYNIFCQTESDILYLQALCIETMTVTTQTIQKKKRYQFQKTNFCSLQIPPQIRVSQGEFSGRTFSWKPVAPPSSSGMHWFVWCYGCWSIIKALNRWNTLNIVKHAGFWCFVGGLGWLRCVVSYDRNVVRNLDEIQRDFSYDIIVAVAVVAFLAFVVVVVVVDDDDDDDDDGDLLWHDVLIFHRF